MSKHPAVGKVVTIYLDPITREHIEGQAKIRRVLFDDGAELIRCEVSFLRDHEICDRWIDREQLA